MSVAVEELLRVEGLRVSLGDVAILHGIDLQLFGGEVLGLVGPNGSGKTTLLRAVSRLVPSSGRIWLAGADVRTLDERGVALRAARVPQATILDATMALTVEDVVMAGRSPHLGRFQWETAHDRALAREAMQSTATDVLAERLAAELSGGERQRAFLARALAQQPRVLLLDEPTANLDIGHQVRVLGLVRKLAGSSGLAALAAIHDLELAARFCDRLVLLQEGRVVIQGTPGEVIRAEWLREVYGVSAIVESNPHVRGLRVTVLEAEQ